MHYYRQKNGKFRPHFDWIAIWLFRGMIAIFLYAGAGAVYHRLTIAWQGVVNEQKELYYEAKRISAEYVPILPQIAHAEKRETEDVEELKAEVVERLRVLESGGYVSDDSNIFLTFDPPASLKKKCAKVGGIAPQECFSAGEWQAKTETIILWNKMLSGANMSQKEALELALDTPRMREFVTRVIFDLPPGQIWHWSAAVKEKAWFNEKITHIRNLQK